MMQILSEIKHNGYQQKHMLDENVVLDKQKTSYHCHQGYEIYYYISGDVSFIIEGNQYKLDKRCFLVIRPMEFHNIIFHSPAQYEHFYINFSTDELKYVNLDEGILEPFLNRPPGVNNLYYVHEHDHFYDLFDKLKNAANLSEPERFMQAQFLLGELLLQVSLKNKNELVNFRNTSSNTLINDVIMFLNSHITENISIDQLATKFFVSKYYLCHRFKSVTNISINEYILQKRIAIAKRLLENGVRPTAVASQCGFSEYSTFYRAFKRLTGKKPEDYKTIKR